VAAGGVEGAFPEPEVKLRPEKELKKWLRAVSLHFMFSFAGI
jgi:hypothetical protein